MHKIYGVRHVRNGDRIKLCIRCLVSQKREVCFSQPLLKEFSLTTQSDSFSMICVEIQDSIKYCNLIYIKDIFRYQVKMYLDFCDTIEIFLLNFLFF